MPGPLPVGKQTPLSPAGTGAVTSKPTTDPRPVEAPTGPTAYDNESVRKQLSNKVWSGKASEHEIKMLKAACSALGDRACRDRAAQELARKQGGG